MADIRVDCVNKTDRQSAHERIHSLGGPQPSGNGRWKMSQEDVIRSIDTREHRFFVERPAGHKVWLIVSVSALGNKYVKTTADGEQPDNLLALPECG